MNPAEPVTLGRVSRRLLRVGLSSQVLTVLCLMYLVMYIERGNIATVAPRMSADLGLSNTQFGLAISYPYALFQLIGGWVSDRFGPRRALMLSGLVVCVATTRTGFVGGLGSLIAARVVLGFGEGSASHRDPCNVGLDAARPLGIRARRYPLCLTACERADAAAHCGIDGLYLLAWLVRGAGTVGPGLGRPLVVGLSR